MPVRGDAVRGHAGGRLGGAEERLGRRHVPVLAEHDVDRVAVAVDRSIQVMPPTSDFEIRFIHVPRAPPNAAFAPTALSEFGGQKSLSIGDLTVENGTGTLALYGSLNVTRDQAGLKQARDLLALLQAAVHALEQAHDLPEKIVQTVETPKMVKNPFA